MTDYPPTKLTKLDISVERTDSPQGPSCNVCSLQHPTENCPLINTGIRITDTELPTKAVLTLPDTLEGKKCEDGSYKIIAKQSFLKGTQFGPLNAPKFNHFNPKCSYMLQIFEENHSYYLDTSDESVCNWMTLVPFTPNSAERNCFCYQLGSDIFFTVVENIEIGDSLKVGYSPGYFARLQESNSSPILASDNSETFTGTLTDTNAGNVTPPTIQTLLPELDDFSPCFYDGTTWELDSSSFDDNYEFCLPTDSEEGDLPDDLTFNFDEIAADPGVQVKLQKLRNRVGAVLALDNWKCKFCYQIFERTVEFTSHLVEHYRRVGAARTEKLRLEKANNNDSHDLQSENEIKAVQFPQVSVKAENGYEVGSLEGSGRNSMTFVSSESESKSGDVLEGYEKERMPEYPYFCDLCVNKKKFNRAEYIIRHLLKHSRDNYCFTCKKIFPERDELKSHICTGTPLKANGKCSKCRFCQLTFQDHSELVDHLKSTHCAGDEAFHKCEVCSKLFCTIDTLHKHSCNKRKKRPKRKSTDEGATPLSTVPPKQEAAENDVAEIYRCEVCYETFPRLIILQNHLRTHGCTFACQFCNKGLMHHAMKSHLAICEVIQEFSNNSTQVLKCPKCIECFGDLDSFRYHVVKHTHPSMCPSCNLRFPNFLGMRSHKCVQFECDGCSDVHDSLIEFKKHILKVHEKASYFCFECALPFITQNGFSEHRGCEVKDEKRKQRTWNDGLFICEFCGMTYNNKSSLKTHQNTHRERRFICDVCGKGFHRREILSAHSFVHRDPQFECTNCQKKFKSRKSLQVHGLTHTSGSKRFTCNDCNKSFRQKIHLVNHRVTHLPPEAQGFTCKPCKKTFTSKEYLGCHIQGHEKVKRKTKANTLGEKVYSCEFCHLTLKLKHSLTRHLKNRHRELENIWTQEGYVASRLMLVEPSTLTSNRAAEESVNDCQNEQQTKVRLPKEGMLNQRKEMSNYFTSSNQIQNARVELRAEANSEMIVFEVDEGVKLVFTLADSEEIELGSEMNEDGYVEFTEQNEGIGGVFV